MRILCLNNSLGSGGAQRQMCMLAVLLKQKGFDVQMLIYYALGFHKSDFFRPLLEEAKIPIHTISCGNLIHSILGVRRAIRTSNPDVVIAYLNRPGLLAELSGLPSRDYALIVSERNTESASRSLRSSLRFFFHRFADAVVSNSYAQQDFIKRTVPRLKSHITTIMNCVDIETFLPAENEDMHAPKDIQVLVIGRFTPQKDPLTLLSAIEILKKENPEHKVLVDWYGNNFFLNGHPTKNSDVFLKLQSAIKKRSLEENFHLHQPVRDVVKLYQGASLFCLPSLYEGCSNVICEAMACGKPILASRVSDNARLVEDGKNGFLFDPHSPRDIANAILRFSSLSAEDRKKMGKESRKRAESMLAPSRFVREYIQLIDKVKKARENN
jgi:glycosyltransferase involved in cell wall biosynthesis